MDSTRVVFDVLSVSPQLYQSEFGRKKKKILTMTFPAVQGVLLLLALAVCQAHAAEPIIQVTMVVQCCINLYRQVV